MIAKRIIPGALVIGAVMGLFAAAEASAQAGAIHTDPIELVAGEWAHGSISGQSEYWYSFPVTEGASYHVWWNDFDGTLAGDIRVFAFYSGGTAIFGGSQGIDMGWNAPQTFVADRTGAVLLRVVPFSPSLRHGAFAIAFDTSDARPPFAINFDREGATALTAGEWTHGVIAGDSEIWFSFEAVAGTPYRVWWNDFDGTLDGDVRISAFHDDGTAIFGDPVGVDMGWNVPQWFMADRTGTVFLRAVPHSATMRHGGFAITFGTAAARPAFAMQIDPQDVVALTTAEWTHGTIAGDSELWFSFPVAEGLEYRVWWNDFDGTLDGDIRVSAFYDDGTEIFGGMRGIDMGWNSPQVFAADRTGTALLRAIPFSTFSRGAFAITYNTVAVRPAFTAQIEPRDAIALTDGVWETGVIDGFYEFWYSFEVAAGTVYNVWWNTVEGGTLDGDVDVIAFFADGEQIFEGWEGWNAPHSFVADRSGTVYLLVEPYREDGSFAVVFSTADERPYFGYSDSEAATDTAEIEEMPLVAVVPVPAAPVPAAAPAPIFPHDVIALDTAVWAEGEISGDTEAWFSFPVAEGLAYHVWWNDYDGTLDGDIRVFAFRDDGAPIFGDTLGEDMGWEAPHSFVAGWTGTAILRVVPFSIISAGAYAIAYTMDNERPHFAAADDHHAHGHHGHHGDGCECGHSCDRDSCECECECGHDGHGLAHGHDGHGHDEHRGGCECGHDGHGLAHGHGHGGHPETEEPQVRFEPRNALALAPAIWTPGTIAGDSELWFSFPVTAGAQYHVWWNDYDGTLDGDIRVFAFRNDGTPIFGGELGVDMGWETPSSFVAAETGEVFLLAVPFSIISAGAFAITYSTEPVRPYFAGVAPAPAPVPVQATPQISPRDVVPIVTATWAEGTIAGDSELWFSFAVAEGLAYHVWWNDYDGTLDGDVRVFAFRDDGTPIFGGELGVDIGWDTPQVFVADWTGAALLLVVPFSIISAGDFAVTYNTTNVRPGF